MAKDIFLFSKFLKIWKIYYRYSQIIFILNTDFFDVCKKKMTPKQINTII